MNRKDIIRMAREAGFGVLLSVDGRGEIYAGDDVYTDEMERFAELIIAAEREACAKQAENMDAAVLAMLNITRQPIAIAAAIRARGDK